MTQDTTPSALNEPVTWPPTPWTAPAAAPPLVDRLPDRLAARAVVASVVAGFLAQLLFVDQSGGLNVVVWVAVVIGTAFVLRRADARLDKADAWLPAAALAFAGFIALRDDVGLFLFDFLASGALTLASVVAVGGQSISRNAGRRIAVLGGSAVLVAASGAAYLAQGIGPLLAAIPSFGGGTTASRIFRGLLIALPLLLGFVLLFAAADAVFQNIVRNVFDVHLNAPELIGRSIFAFLAGWLFAGTLAAAWLSRERFTSDSSSGVAAGSRCSPLSSVEGITVLAVLDALFAVFVVIQAAYLFPGADPLAASGMTYADYARRGFFELVLVAVMSGMVLLFLDALIDTTTRAYRLAAAALALLSGVILVSAAVRLGLYQQAYGWTELRFYVLAAIILLALGVVATVAALAGRRVHLIPKFILGAGFAIALVCNAIGPQSFVTAQNLQRAANPTLVPADGWSGLDTDYLDGLGADAVPALLEMRDRIPFDEYNRVTVLLESAASDLREQARAQGWPSWNLSRQAALDALAAAGF